MSKESRRDILHKEKHALINANEALERCLKSDFETPFELCKNIDDLRSKLSERILSIEFIEEEVYE